MTTKGRTMNAFNKVLERIHNTPVNGHALRNTQNIKSLTKANKEIEKIMRQSRLVATK